MARLTEIPEGEREMLQRLPLPSFDTTPFVKGQPLSERRVSILSTAALQKRDDRIFYRGEASYDEKTIAENVDQSWVWRNVFVADTDAEAEALGVPYFREMRVYLSENRQRMNTPEELAAQTRSITGAARDSVDHGLIFGSPETVCEKLAPL